jgi:alkanesulfonate monooxygenase SsuD/methylene tetrahydromethanopterin reductase-like flavin-dependent oxidoreductase (luciferase family)
VKVQELQLVWLRSEAPERILAITNPTTSSSGSPETVTEQLVEQVKATGIGNVLFFNDFRVFDHQDLVRSHDLIGAHVIPALRSCTPRQ